MKDDVSSGGPSDALDRTPSPYETRLREWMSNWPPDLRKDEAWNYDPYSPEWVSEDCNTITSSIWDISLWDGE